MESGVEHPKKQLGISYGEKKYWEEKYAKGTTFDWYLEYRHLKRIFRETLKKLNPQRILIVGCGNSLLSEEIYKDGFQENQIIGIDIASNVIDQMNSRELTKLSNGKIIYETMDCTQMNYDDNSFDLIIDKGTIDALACSDDDEYNIRSTVSECMRVLRPGGIYMVISFGEESRRMHFFKGKGEVRCEAFVNEEKRAPGNVHYIYTTVKE